MAISSQEARLLEKAVLYVKQHEKVLDQRIQDWVLGDGPNPVLGFEGVPEELRETVGNALASKYTRAGWDVKIDGGTLIVAYPNSMGG